MNTLARHSVSSQLKDLLARPVSVSYEIVQELKDWSKPSKAIAGRVMAAAAILRAAGDGSHSNSALETILERTEGKVASGEQPAGTLIQFTFNLAPGQLPEARASRLVNPMPTPALREPKPHAQRDDEYADAEGSD